MGRGIDRTLRAGDRAPDFRLANASGTVVSLDDLLAEGPVLLAFYKVTCPTCQLTLPYLERLAGGGVRVVAISQDDPGASARFDREFGVHLETLFDKASDGYPVSNAFGIEFVPSLFLVEPGKSIAAAVEGFSKREMTALAGRAGKLMFGPQDYVPEMKAG
jgi:peroxiredoxin